MAKRRTHDIITEGGAVGVLLSNRPDRVWVDQADFDRIVKAHGNRAWAWIEAARYVKLNVGHMASVSVARLVVGNSDRFIRYADGDHLNLRRENLSTEKPVRPGKGKKRAKPSKPGPLHSAREMVRARFPVVRRTVGQTPSPSPPVSAQFVKRSRSVVGTVKRQRTPGA